MSRRDLMWLTRDKASPRGVRSRDQLNPYQQPNPGGVEHQLLESSVPPGLLFFWRGGVISTIPRPHLSGDALSRAMHM